MPVRRALLVFLATTSVSSAALCQGANPLQVGRDLSSTASPAFIAERKAEQAIAPAATAPSQADAAKPADAKTRAAIAQTDFVTQARFWNDEFAKNPADLQAGQALAAVLRRIGSYERATQIAQQGIAAHPGDAILWSELGLSLIAAERGADAIGPLQRAAQLNPRDPKLPSALGVAYDQAGQPELARAAYQQALLMSPNDADVLSNLGFSWVLAGDLKQAETVLRQAVAIPSAPAQARQNLAMVIGLQGRFDEARQIAARDVSPEMAAQNIAWLRSMVDQPSRWDALRNAPQ